MKSEVIISTAPSETLSPQLLDVEHYQTLDVALTHLLSTQSAHDAFAQLFDGVPPFSVVAETFGARNTVDAPIRQHTTLCEGAAERADTFISNFDTASLCLSTPLLQSFQNSDLGSSHSFTLLLDLLARSIHCIAVSISRSALKLHSQEEIRITTSYQDPPIVCEVGNETRQGTMTFPPKPPVPSLFFHSKYLNHEEYPFGVHDVVGYWAEDRIFGGVVLFDRGESGTEHKNVWLHSGRLGWTTRVWKPLDWQLEAMQKFFATGRLEDISSEAAKRESELTQKQLMRMKSDKWKRGFPFFCDIDNFDRHDHYDAMTYHNIYRDLGERRLPATKPDSGPINLRDYPELTSITEAIIYDRGPSYSVSGPIEIPDTIEEAQNKNAMHGLEEKSSEAANRHDYLYRASSNSQHHDSSVWHSTVDGKSSEGKQTSLSHRSSRSSLKSSDENFIGTYDGRDFHYAPAYKERQRKKGGYSDEDMANVGKVVGYTIMGQEIRLNPPDHDLQANDAHAKNEEDERERAESGDVSDNGAKP